MDIWILAGQSNMAGRGNEKIVYNSSREIFLFDTENDEWLIAKDPLHKDKSYSGVGLALTFAINLLSSTSLSPSRDIGLVPCAVGGTSIHQWLPPSKLETSVVIKKTFILPSFTSAYFYSSNGQQSVAVLKDSSEKLMEKEKELNSYSKLIEATKKSLLCTNKLIEAEGNTLKGILWMQGESDCGKEVNSQKYYNRMSSFLSSLYSDLSLPNSFPFVLIAISSCCPKKSFINSIRKYQRQLCEERGLLFVDSVGCERTKNDPIHLNSNGLKVLGERVYKKVINEIEDDREEKIYIQLKKDVNRLWEERSRMMEEKGERVKLPTFKIFQANATRGITFESFTYGEVEAASFRSILTLCQVKEGDIFWDLGSGKGTALLFASLLYPSFSKVNGIELCEGYYNESLDLISSFYSYAVQNKIMYPKINIVKGDFLIFNDWVKESDVIFISTTCFSEELVNSIAKLATACKISCRIITLDVILGSHFEVVKVSSAVMSWGLATVYISQRKEDLS